MGDIVRNVLQRIHHKKKNKCDIVGKQRWIVVSPRGTWYQYKQKLVAEGLAAEPPKIARIITLSLHCPRARTLITGPKPELTPTHKTRITSSRPTLSPDHPQRNWNLLTRNTYDIYACMQSAAAVAALCVTILLLLLLSAAIVAAVSSGSSSSYPCRVSWFIKQASVVVLSVNIMNENTLIYTF